MRARLILFPGLLSVVLALTAGSVSAQTAFERQTVSEGYGVGKILVRYSKDSDVTGEYGDDNRIIKHGSYSTGIAYEKLGLAFYYCQADPEKEIFSIHIKAPFKADTSRGVILGVSTKEEAELLYKDHPIQFSDYYEGIRFQYGKGVVNEISIFEASGLRQCHVRPAKRH